MGYEKRQLVKLVEDICEEEGFKFESFSDNWIIQLTNQEGKKGVIYGYKFPNNNAAISKVCDDKAGLSDVLKSNKIPHVEHMYFEGSKSPMIGEEGLWTTLLNLFKKNGKLVLKANSGSGGTNVYKCETIKELEIATFSLLKSHRSMTVSPYIDIENEYRIIVQNGKAMVIYAKQRPNVTGDGKSTIKELIEQNGMGDVDVVPTIDLESVPAEGENVTISWKHNLGQGSLPIMIRDKDLIAKLTKFALQTAETLNLDFASVDIVKDRNGGYKVLEINSGIMMETFSRLSEENYEIAKHIYRSAIYDYFDMPKKDYTKTVYEVFSEELIKKMEGKENARRTSKTK